MNFKYYNNGCRDYILPITDIFKGIRSPDDLYFALLNVWSEESCTPRLREKWNEENVTLGQCSITAFLAQDIFGGRVFGIPRPDGNFHCYNVVGNSVFDLTSEQFGDEILDYSNSVEQFREVHFSDENKKERYEYLCVKLKEFLELADETTEIKKHKNYFYIFLCIIVGINYFVFMVLEVSFARIASCRNSTIPITVGGRTYNVTSCQNVTVNTPGGTTTYNVRFVDGKPVAIDMSQYNTLVFGETQEKQENKTNEKSEIPEKQNAEPINIAPSPKQNVSVNTTRDTTTYNVDGKTVALDKSQYNTLVLGETPKKEENKPLKKQEYKTNEKFEIPEKQNTDPIKDTPSKPIPAQTSYPIVFNIKIKSDDEEDDKIES